VPRRRLAELAVEEQVAGLGLAHVAADEVGVALDQRFGVGKLGEGAVTGVGRLKAAGTDAKQARAEGRLRVAPGAQLISPELLMLLAPEALRFVRGEDQAPGPVRPLQAALGWQVEAYSTILERPVTAELEESILRGGKRCVYRITVI